MPGVGACEHPQRSIQCLVREGVPCVIRHAGHADDRCEGAEDLWWVVLQGVEQVERADELGADLVFGRRRRIDLVRALRAVDRSAVDHCADASQFGVAPRRPGTAIIVAVGQVALAILGAQPFAREAFQRLCDFGCCSESLARPPGQGELPTSTMCAPVSRRKRERALRGNAACTPGHQHHVARIELLCAPRERVACENLGPCDSPRLAEVAGRVVSHVGFGVACDHHAELLAIDRLVDRQHSKPKALSLQVQSGREAVVAPIEVIAMRGSALEEDHGLRCIGARRQR